MGYSNDPSWADVVPFPQDDGGPNPLAAIAYTEGYAEAMSYLRAVMAANEMSERALELTEDIIGMNPAHYTVWLYRAKILTTLSSNLHHELAWLNHVALAHQKNYQIWHHRQFLLERIGDPAGEIAFINRMLAGDEKNYHVWSYRQWLVRRFGLWASAQENGRREIAAALSEEEGEDGEVAPTLASVSSARATTDGSGESREATGDDSVKQHTTELEETEIIIANDVRNNSAWNHRFFIVNGNGSGVQTDPHIYDREVLFTQEAIRKAPQNQSPWNYLRGTVERAKGKKGIVAMKAFCEEFVQLGDDGGTGEKVRSSHATQILAEVYGLEGERDRAGQLLELLASKYDPIRANYWNYLKDRIGVDVVGTPITA